MSKSKLVAILVAALVVIGGVYVLTLGSNNNETSKPTNTSSQNQANPSTTSSEANQGAAEGSIDIKNMMFTPPQITVKKGGKVTWANNDGMAHTITIDQGSGPDSGTVEPGSTYSFTFDKAGSYQYHCDIHPSMRGTVVVK